MSIVATATPQIANGGAATSSTTLTVSTVAQLDAGNVGIVVVAFDNINNVDGDNSEVTGVTDSAGNTYTKLGEYTNGGGAPGDGVTVSVWQTKATNTLVSGNYTVTFASAIVRKSSVMREFEVTTTLVLDAPVQNSEVNGANSFGSSSFSGLSSKERLYFRGLGKEANSLTLMTPTSGYSAFSGGRSDNDAAAIISRGEYIIETSTGTTSSPALAVSGDTAGVFLALAEPSVGGGIVRQMLQHHG